jgi:hypothetical protein
MTGTAFGKTSDMNRDYARVHSEPSVKYVTAQLSIRQAMHGNGSSRLALRASHLLFTIVNAYCIQKQCCGKRKKSAVAHTLHGIDCGLTLVFKLGQTQNTLVSKIDNLPDPIFHGCGYCCFDIATVHGRNSQ